MSNIKDFEKEFYEIASLSGVVPVGLSTNTLIVEDELLREFIREKLRAA